MLLAELRETYGKHVEEHNGVKREFTSDELEWTVSAERRSLRNLGYRTFEIFKAHSIKHLCNRE